MKKLYTFSFLILFFLISGCSKDFLKSYDTRIIGTWRITDVSKFGLGGNTDKLPFNDGAFTFYEDGSLVYIDGANNNYKGSWDISKKIRDTTTVHTLVLTAVNFTTQQVLTQYYDEMDFTSTNHFKAKIISTFHTYTTDFKR